MDRQIDIQIPISADLNKPKLGLKQEIIKAVENALIKVPTSPFRGIKLAESRKDEGYIELDWKLRQSKLSRYQEHQLKNISRHLFFHPKTSVNIKPYIFEDKEKDMILFFEAKKVFYCTKNNIAARLLSEDDSDKISRISNKDSIFLHYLNHIPNALKEYTTQGKCLLIISQARVDALYNKLRLNRRDQVLNYFKDKNVSDRVTFDNSIITIPTIGFSHYLFYYNGDQPDKNFDLKQ